MRKTWSHCSINLTYHTRNWVIDLGASFHTAHCDYFTSYVNGDYGHIRIGNERASKIVSIRDICLATSMDHQLLLKDVIHIPDICLNLVFTCKLDNDYYTNQFGERK